MEVVTILFILWVIVFVFWAAGQFAAYNRRKEKE